MLKSSPHIYSRDEKVWFVKNLWELSKDLPAKRYHPQSIIDLTKIEMTIWWEDVPSAKSFAGDLDRITKTNLKYPIIISAEGNIMDGFHRLFKAILFKKTILVRQFVIDPEPDYYQFEIDS